MRTLKTMLLGLGVPFVLVLAGVGQTASARATDEVATLESNEGASLGGPIVIFPWPITCEIVLCSPGTYCVDTDYGPTCVPFPDPIDK